MFKADSTNYHKIGGGGNRFLFNANLDDQADRTRRTANAWSGSPTTAATAAALSGEPTAPTSPSANTSIMDTSLRMGDLQSPSGNSATGRAFLLSPGMGLAKAGTGAGGRIGEGGAGDAVTGGYGAGGLPGAFGAGAGPHHDRAAAAAASGNDDEDCYLPSYLLGVNTAAPKEQYAAPLEPETSRALQEHGAATAPGKLFPPFAGYRAPLNAYDADDDAPPQTSLLDLTNDNEPTPSAYMPVRQQSMAGNASLGGAFAGQDDRHCRGRWLIFLRCDAQT
ncbi:hypothetical protein SYNPS1DRAFT_29594 [Syncephalis pseudoplumigaleata]|uniref:Uncharacterized protein n=1 Tax=Syncephalis pseudoplumigaleata TaxID=1712513 RepID=A0A4P9Z005_9FUNG|nr:hypothetical protein SYNPS1DRAFT_29594 [Syncephalis pseudoplumigaleata]|eukprot:RKP24650.1 hypothetical protein SYNPS1DRAFT_29594 [Syncephalis pseudoplumigaleata]